MDFGGRYRFAAPRADVWAALNDAAILKAAIPGCEKLDWTGPTTLDLKVRISLGIVHPVFSGELVLSDIHPAEHYRLSGRGKGLLGLAQGGADIALVDDGDGTILTFTAEGKADGGVMRLGKALIGNSAQAVIDGFFERIAQEMGVVVTTQPPPQS
ncbi:MAG: carbon monoxide dehydrogenase subunit G [Devosia sp.]